MKDERGALIQEGERVPAKLIHPSAFILLPFYFSLLLGATLFATFPGQAQEATGVGIQHKHYALSSQPGGRESELVVSDTDSRKTLRRIPLGRGAYRLLAYPPDNRLYVLTRADLADIWVVDARTDRVIGQMATVPSANDMALNGEGTRLYVIGAGVQVLDTASGREMGIIPLPESVSQLTDIQVAQDGHAMLVKPAYKTAEPRQPNWMLLQPDPEGRRGEFRPWPVPPGEAQTWVDGGTSFFISAVPGSTASSGRLLPVQRQTAGWVPDGVWRGSYGQWNPKQRTGSLSLSPSRPPSAVRRPPHRVAAQVARDGDQAEAGSTMLLATGAPPPPGRVFLARSGLSSDLALAAATAPTPNGRLVMVGSKNRNYVLVADPVRSAWQELIPVDAGVDALLVSTDRTRGYVYHRGLGQITYLHLQPDQPTTFEAFRRVRLNAFSAPDLQLTEQANRIYLWDGQASPVAAIDIYGEKVQPILRPETVEVRLFRPIHHVQECPLYQFIFYVRDGRVQAENTVPWGRQAPRTWNVKVEGKVASLALTPDQRHLYAVVPERNVVAVINTVNLRIEAEVPVGKNPQEVVMSSDGDLAYVLNVGDASITTIDALNRDVERTWSLPPLNTARLVRVYDQANHALLQIHTPVYADDGSLRIAPLP